MFAIFTACRTGEVLGACWKEVDMDAGIWTVPAERMKARREHRVSLSQPALKLLKCLQAMSTGPNSYLFPVAKQDKPLLQMVMLMLLRRMNTGPEKLPHRKPFRWRDGQTGLPITTHGFRSTFRDWAGETTGHPRDVVEAALAHVIAGKTEAAYARGDLFAKRALLMEDRAAYCMHFKEGVER